VSGLIVSGIKASERCAGLIAALGVKAFKRCAEV